jgi:hypothetical protein
MHTFSGFTARGKQCTLFEYLRYRLLNGCVMTKHGAGSKYHLKLSDVANKNTEHPVKFGYPK